MMQRQPQQRGAALLIAMIIVTLIASLAGGMVWQQYRAVQIEAADRARAQSGWVLQGALDWARLILKTDSAAVDELNDFWATPLAESRLSTFLAADGATTGGDDDGPEAFLSGYIEDAQARYNLRALLGGTQVPADEKLTLELLCSQVNAPPGTADLIITGLRAAFPSAASAASAAASSATVGAVTSGPLQPAGLDQLTWLGLDTDTIKRLQPYLVLLPKATPVNLNTAPREVIRALLNIDLASAERVVQGRKSKAFKTTADAAPFLPTNTTIATGRASVNSSYFIVTGRLRLDERQLEQRSLIERQGKTTTVLARERVSQLLDQ
jgi:general secretion pathway protein K